MGVSQGEMQLPTTSSGRLLGAEAVGRGAGAVAPGEAAREAAAFEASKRAVGLGFAHPLIGALVLGNTLMGGSGMLGIPHALSVAGYGLGLVLIVLFGSLSAFGSHLLHCAARKIGTAPCSFFSVSNAVVPRWTWLIDAAVMIKCFGVGTSYLVIVGDMLPDTLHYWGATDVKRWHAVTGGFCVAGSLAFFKNLSRLKYTAAFSIVAVLWTGLLVILMAAEAGPAFEPCADDATLPCNGAAFVAIGDSSAVKLGKALPVFIFAFTCQQNVFSVCNEVRDATRARLDGILAMAYIAGGLCFGSTAFFGYATYGNAVTSDVLKAYPQSGIVEVTRLFYSILVIFSYPLQAHPSRASALALWSSLFDRRAAGAAAAPPFSERRFRVATCLGLALSYSVAILVQDLGVVLGIVGATGSTTVSYILPGLVYFQAHREWHLKRVLALFQLCLGCVIMPVCLVMVLL